MDAAWRIKSSKYLQLAYLHSHIGTFVLEPRAYAAQIQLMCDFMHKVEEETGCVIEVLDIGGGFASHNALQGIYLPPAQVVPSIEQYAEAICDPLMALTHEREKKGPRLQDKFVHQFRHRLLVNRHRRCIFQVHSRGGGEHPHEGGRKKIEGNHRCQKNDRRVEVDALGDLALAQGEKVLLQAGLLVGMV